MNRWIKFQIFNKNNHVIRIFYTHTFNIVVSGVSFWALETIETWSKSNWIACITDENFFSIKLSMFLKTCESTVTVGEVFYGKN